MTLIEEKKREQWTPAASKSPGTKRFIITERHGRVWQLKGRKDTPDYLDLEVSQMEGQGNGSGENPPTETKEPRTSSGRAGPGWIPIKTEPQTNSSLSDGFKRPSYCASSYQLTPSQLCDRRPLDARARIRRLQRFSSHRNK
ncbi:hypothetical protein OJAV_G00201600 [Oryzias javanicus]|uniref:Uncharacterized protein n=1 Tax=Oryzias javanicus TaxID=123683 RepID=A0A3S2LQU2_ORYJA|nr:hypothetical protein OJAV_G00201600 [Oryzias javanicus]